MRNFVKIKKFFWPKMPDSKYEKAKLVENSRFHQFSNFGSFRVVSQFFGVLVSTRFLSFCHDFLVM